VPSLSADLRPTAAQLLWIVDIYGFMVAGSLLLMGTLGDRIGRRKLLLIGAGAFSAVSVLAAFSSSAEMLIAARALLGIAGATLAPSTLSLISSMFPDERQRTFAVSIWVASFSLGGALGPVLGGLLLAHFWWGSVFLIAIPVTLPILVLGPSVLPEFRNPHAGRLDVLSAALSVLAVLPVVYGIKLAAEGDSLAVAALALLPGLLFGTLFVRRQMRLAEPLLDLRLFRRRAMTAALMINLLDFFVGFGMLVLVAQYLQLVLGLTPLEAGLWSLPTGFGFVAGSLLTSPMLRLMQPSRVLGLGLAVGAAGLVLMAWAAGTHDLALFVFGNVLMSMGTAPGTAIVADLVVSSAPPAHAGAASALNETASEFGGALGIALLGSLATFLYRAGLAPNLPAALSPEATTTALRGIGSASAVAPTIAGGPTLLAAARDAYTAAAQASFLTGAVLVALTAIVALVMFRNLTPTRPTAS
jgi:DHA2 family multidrug resistance protein-like MFS transporter